MATLGSGCFAQLAEWLHPTSEVYISSPDIGKFLYWTFVHWKQYWKDKYKEKEARNWPFLKTKQIV